MKNKETILESFSARVRGKLVSVLQIFGAKSRQDIYYRVNGKKLSSNKYFGLKPIKVN